MGNDKFVWKPKLIDIEGEVSKFVEINGIDYPLAAMVAAAAGVQPLKNERYRLANVRGWQEVKALRNSKQAEEFGSQPSSPGDFFAEESKKKPAKKKRLSRARTGDRIMHVQLDPTHSAWIQRPMVSFENIICRCDMESIQGVLGFIVKQGITYEELVSTRNYKKDEESMGVADALPAADIA